ncbi:ATP-grasp domain-containing protein [Hymenobacter cellulosivorans]|uniref:ATP-grasp domain-containing protein n=1 Tax=Hymenobacter cellulosivorans TaxID=2932249 RepID=A0ABY4FC95_9BACT|nr:ATP-grasp domain-containing protein [Hymenobacter cellulosivorans]UOQ54150.1 ATP-grasp domain-containing protein [Hymenobacter cellulosivorans]
MQIIYPSLPYQPATVDPLWVPEYAWARAHGFDVALFDIETDKLLPRLSGAAPALYRGWMLSAAEYEQLAHRTPLLVSPAEYLASHQASGWYEAIRDFTFTSSFQPAAQMPAFSAGQRYFVKGLVKSFGPDSVVATAEQWHALAKKHELSSTDVLFVRKFTEVLTDSERRFFVVDGKAYGALGTKLPVELKPVLPLLAPRKFYSLDIAQTAAGRNVVVEVGDGQVSDLKEWSLADFGPTVLRALSAV